MAVLGKRVGETPYIGDTLAAHAIADDDSVTSLCGAWTSQGWAAGGAPNDITHMGQVTCGWCLATLTKVNFGPPSG